MKAKKRQNHLSEALLLTLACGATVEAAAGKLGVTNRTVYRYLNDASFRRRLQEYRGDMVSRAAGMLTAAAMESVKTLLELMARSSAGATRLGAARAVLELGLKLRQAADLEERMVRIEEALHLRTGETKALSFSRN